MVAPLGRLRGPRRGVCDRHSSDTWRGVRLQSVKNPGWAACATRRSLRPHPRLRVQRARVSSSTPSAPQGEDSLRRDSPEGEKDWLELNRENLGIDSDSTCSCTFSPQNSLAQRAQPYPSSSSGSRFERRGREIAVEEVTIVHKNHLISHIYALVDHHVDRQAD